MLKQLVSSFLQSRRKRGYIAFGERCRDVGGAQEELLLRLVKRNGQTELGRRLNVPQVRSLDDLRRLVPITDYDAIQPELQCALAGDPNQLVPGRPTFFGMTSGTTGRAKYIPIDEAYRAEFQSTVQHFLYGIVRDHPTALSKKALYLVGPAALEITAGGATAGSISGHNLRRLPALIRSLYAAPADAFEIPDAERQAYAVARFALAAELSSAFAVTTAPLAFVGASMERNTEALLRDIHDGTLDATGIPPQLHGTLSQSLKRDPARAAVLASRVAGGKRPIPKNFFPDLALISCWHHASAGSHLPALRDLWGDVPIRPGLYSATEGWMNVPLSDAHPTHPPSGVLAADAVVLEFLGADGVARFAHELHAPGRYEVLITSGAGLWRYRIGDEVEVTGFFEQLTAATPKPTGHAPMFHFVQKAGNVLSLAHDMTSEAHVRQAIYAALSDARRWVFGPSPDTVDSYRVILESADREEGSIDPRAVTLDGALRAANMGYNADRLDGLLRPIEVTTATPATFDAWEAGRRTAVLSQAKPTVFVKSSRDLPGFARPARLLPGDPLHEAEGTPS